MSVIPSDIACYGSLCMPAYDGAATLNGAIGSTTATTLTINTPTSAFPSSGEFAIQIDSEIMWVTQGAPGSSAGTLTVIRGFAGTTAATHSNAAAVTMPSGAGIDFLTKVSFTDVTSGDTVSYISSSASDTKPQITLTGRDTTGVLQSETKTLNGTTAVAGSQVWDRFLKASLAAVTTCTNNPLTAGGTTLTVASGSALPASGNYYVQLGKEVMQVTAGQGTTSLTVSRAQLGTTATAHASGDGVYLLPLGDVAVVDSTKVINGHTPQTGSANPSGTTPALFKLQSGDGATVALGQVIVISSGTGSGQIRTIIATSGYGTDVVAVSRSWGVVPDNTSVYSVYNGMQLDLAPNQVTQCQRFLWNAASDVPGGSSRSFYEKVYAVNNNTATALTSATAQISSDTPSLPGSAALDIAMATAQNDVQSVATRQTAFSTGYGSYITQPAATSFGANSGNLANGAAPNAAGSQGIVLRMTLPAGTSAYKGSANLQTNGNTI
jgi:hypothetical protein